MIPNSEEKICKKCEWILNDGGNFNEAICNNPNTPMPINEAREVCNKEGDGRFVYLERVDR